MIWPLPPVLTRSVCDKGMTALVHLLSDNDYITEAGASQLAHECGGWSFDIGQFQAGVRTHSTFNLYHCYSAVQLATVKMTVSVVCILYLSVLVI